MASTSRDPGGLHETSALVGDLLTGRTEAARARLARRNLSPDALLRVAEQQSLGWFFLEHVENGTLRDLLPDDAVDLLVERGHRRRQLRDRQVAGVQEVLPALESAGVEPVLLKGLHLQGRFPRVAARTFADTDVLVPRAHADEAGRVLASLGFALESRPLVSAALTRHFAHGFDFVRGDQRVDLHWNLASHWSYALDEAGLHRRCRALSLPGGGVARVLADEDLLHELLVSFFEDLDRGGGRLRSALDIEAVLAEVDSTLDWDSFWRARRTDRTAGPCTSSLSVALASIDAHGRFPGASGSAAAARPDTTVPTREAVALLDRAGSRRHNKRWAMDRYDCPRWKHGAWWIASLPFRLAVYGTRPRVATGGTPTGRA